jgi:hypothetical protein
MTALRPEQADAPKPAMTSEFQIGNPRRGFGNPYRYGYQSCEANASTSWLHCFGLRLDHRQWSSGRALEKARGKRSVQVN